MIKAMRYLYGTQEESSGLSRRRFLKVVSLGAAGFMVGCAVSTPKTAATGAAVGAPNASSTPAETGPPAAQAAKESLNAFVKVGSDDTVTVVIKHAEFGQGVTTGLTTIVAEEIDARWDQMRWEFSPADASRYANTQMGIQGTGGSSSIANSWNQLRDAGAAAKAMLIAAAASAWQVKPEEVNAADGKLSHKNGKSGSYGEFAAAAAKQTPPDKPTLKEPKEFKFIGKSVARLDSPAKSTGKAQFTIDVDKPGMVMASVAHPPRFGGKVKSFDAKDALAVPGVKEVVQIPSGVAVVADSFWTAQQARAKLKIEWDDSQAEQRGSDELFAHYKQLATKAGSVAADRGDTAAAQKAGKAVAAEYQLPYLAHATMEPMGCVAEIKDDGVTLTYGAQVHTLDQTNVAAIFGYTPDKVTIESVFGGGSFGRRANPPSDYVVEAVQIAKALKEKVPVKLTWDRTNDLRAGFYRPMSYHQVAGSVDAKGKPDSYFQRIVCQSFLKGSPFEGMIKDGVDAAMVEGAANLAYSVPNLKVEAHIVDGVKVPTLWWRSVGHTHNAFVTETFFDRLCAEGGTDPVEMRRQLLKDHPRHLGALNLAVEKAGPAPKGEGKGRGVAVHEAFNTFVAEVVDITVKAGKLAVDKVVCAVDCGLAVNPEIVKAQMESGIIFGLSAALAEEIVLEKGRVKQANFDGYPIARMSVAPEIEVHIVPSAEAPTGVGEPGVPPLAPALANALHQATGKWITRLPLKLEGLV